AVDYEATVWICKTLVFTHRGGYTPFSIDITELLPTTGPCEIVVRAEDDPGDLAKPRGKQDWQVEPHSIWYPRTTGIWQTVWLEVVPAASIAHVRWRPSLDRWEMSMNAAVEGDVPPGTELRLRLDGPDRVLAADSYQIVSGEVNRSIA